MRKTYWFCSMDHMKQFKQHYKKEKKDMDVNQNERDAIKASHPLVGEWLKEKGEADLRKLPQNDQYEFMLIVYVNVCAELSRIEAAKNDPDGVPF
ncbi:MAG: hypothetical protein HOM01_09230 [Kordiimonadaceae bacterium]|nr:hypothetical protein [Kordiimonadaceae bacterium]